jgi:hypothetical protein
VINANCGAHNVSSIAGFVEWKRDPRRIVGFFGYRFTVSDDMPESPTRGLQAEQVPSGSGPYSLLSDRAMFIHSRYIDALPKSKGTPFCHLLLSMQVTAMSSQAPVVMRSRPREQLYATFNQATASLRGGGDIRVCTRKSIPQWLLPNASNPLREEATSILG